MNRIPDSFNHKGIRTPRWLVLEVDKLERPTGRVFVMLDGKRFSKAFAVGIGQQIADLHGISVATVMEYRGAKRNPWQDEYYQGANKARDHRTLTHAGITQAAQFHLLSGRGAPLADLYVGHAWAVKVGQLFADIYGEPVQLVQHDSSFGSVYDEPTERVPAARRNPSRDPAPGETWTAWQSGSKCKVLRVWGSQVEYLDKDNGSRYTETVSEFKATHKPPRTLTNPARPKRARAKRKPKAKRRNGPASYGDPEQIAVMERLGRYAKEYGLEPVTAGFLSHGAIHVDYRDPKVRGAGRALRAIILPGGILQGATQLVEGHSLMIAREAGRSNPRRRNAGYHDPRIKGREFGTPKLGTIKVGRTTFDVYAGPGKYTPFMLGGARGAQYGLIRYTDRPWLFYAVNLNSATGKGPRGLDRVMFTGETFDQLAVFTPKGPAMNPPRKPKAKRRKPKRVGTTSGRGRNAKGHFTRGNPRPFSGERARAERMFEKWHEFPANRIKRVKVPSRIIPKHVVGLGKVVRIDYISNKWEGKPVTYTHDTERPYPELVTDPDGRQLYLVGGKMRPTADGLVH